MQWMATCNESKTDGIHTENGSKTLQMVSHK